MTIIDFHWHLLLEPDEIKKVMDTHGISKIIGMPLDFGGLSWNEILECVGIQEKSHEFRERYLSQLNEINRKCYEKYKACDFIEFVPIISANLQYDNKIILKSQFCEMLQEDWYITSNIVKIIPIFDHCTKHYYTHDLSLCIKNIKQKIIMIHTGWESRILPLLQCIKEHQDKIFILAHMKEDTDEYNKERIMLLKTSDNVYVEMSYLSSPKRLKQYVQMGFEDRILFGSDFRTLDDEVSLEWFINAVKLCKFDTKIEKKIMHENAKKLINGFIKEIHRNTH